MVILDRWQTLPAAQFVRADNTPVSTVDTVPVRYEHCYRQNRLQTSIQVAEEIPIDLPGGTGRDVPRFRIEDHGDDGSLAMIFIF